MWKSALLILSGQTFSSVLLLLRNLIVARLISVEDYGIAATFAISMAIVEMMTTLGLHQMIIQDKNGDDPRLQSGLQGFHLMRSLFSGTILFALATPLANFLGIGEIAWAYQLLALVPVINGVIHFDIYRLQRRMVYLPSILCSAVPAFVSVALVWPLWLYYGDYRVMLYALMAQSILTVVMSHVVAERTYHFTLDQTVIKRSLHFGWPLLINNILLFFIFQGEKIIVGRTLGLEELAIFAMGFTLTLTPSLLLGSSVQTFFLPQLSVAKDDKTLFDRLAMVTFQSHLFFGTVFIIGVMLFAGPVVHLLLSAKYAGLVPLMTWLSILQSMRLFRGGCSTIALAMGKTGISTISNLPRVFSMPIAWYAAVQTGDIFVVLWIAIIGESIGFAISLVLLHYQLKVSLRSAARSFWLTMVLVGGVGLHAGIVYGTPEASPLTTWFTLPIIGLFALALASMTDLHRYVARRKTGVPLG